MTEPRRETMASRGQAAHRPDPKTAPRPNREQIDEDLVWRVAKALTPYLPSVMFSNRREEIAMDAARCAIAAMRSDR